MRTSVRSPEVTGRFRDLSLCERHKDEARLTDFLSPSSWDKIERYMREAAAEHALAKRARSKIGKMAFGKPKSSKIHREYREVDGIYQKTRRK